MRERPYDTRDNDALMDSRIYRKVFLDKINDFTAFDATLDATFAEDWKAANDLAEHQPSDETIRDIQQQHTDEVKTREKDCIRSVNDVRYYLSLAFPNNKDKPKEFGLHKLNKARHSTSPFITWMKVLHNRAVKHQTELSAVGMPAASIDTILANAQALDTAETAQEVYKLERIAITRERIRVHGVMWEYVTRVAAAAEIVFEAQPEIREVFKIPDYRKKKNETGPDTPGDDSDA